MASMRGTSSVLGFVPAVRCSVPGDCEIVASHGLLAFQ
jgi:hypothetical protein